MPLELQSSATEETARITLSGELDAASAPRVRQAVDEALRSNPSRLVLLVENLTFMASAGLRILIFAKQKQPGLKIYFVKPQPAIVDTLQKTGFLQGVYLSDSDIADEATAG